jgi:hypothetical protein
MCAKRDLGGVERCPAFPAVPAEPTVISRAARANTTTFP